MENLYPDNRPASNYLAACTYIASFLLGMLSLISPAQGEDLLPQLATDAPITIDAESSEFDYETSRLVFHSLRMDQGTLGIAADLAETDKLDFTNGVWVFTGNVVLEAEDAKLYCENARLNFVNHQLVEAELNGSPAHFEQRLEGSGRMNSGRANKIVYKLSTGTLELSQDAQFSDGSNEISGDLITYNIQEQHLTAGSGETGPVKILIESPNKEPEVSDTP